jgi:hypothetical protein
MHCLHWILITKIGKKDEGARTRLQASIRTFENSDVQLEGDCGCSTDWNNHELFGGQIGKEKERKYQKSEIYNFITTQISKSVGTCKMLRNRTVV